MGTLTDKARDRHASFLNRHSDRPLTMIACSFALGIALSLLSRNYCFPGIVASDVCLIGAAALSLRRNRLPLCFGLGLAAISVGGFLLAIVCRDAFPETDIRSRLSKHMLQLEEPVSSDGCVVKESEIRGEENVITIDLHAFLHKDRWVVCSGKAIVRIAETDKPKEQRIKLMRGDRVRGWATWNMPRNFNNPGSADSAGVLARRGVFLVGKIKSTRLFESIPGGCIDPWTQIANSIGTRVHKSLEPLVSIEKGQRAAILASLIIGDYSNLSNNTREVFQNSGTFHVLVISGLHVAWLAGVLLQALKWGRIPERICYLLVFFVILLYTCVVGFQASISRCLWMFLLYLIGRAIFRETDATNILLSSAIILLTMQPTWLFETGFQLSFLSVLAIAMTAVSAISNYVHPVFHPLLSVCDPDRMFLQPGRWHRIGRYLKIQCEILIEAAADSLPAIFSLMLRMAIRALARTWLAITSVLITSLAVQMWLQPLLAFYFNRMSWISPLANIVIVPLSSFVLGAGVAASCTMSLPWIGPLWLRLAGFLAALLLNTTSWIANIPGAWQRCPTPSAHWVLGGILLLLSWSFFEWRRFWIACVGIATFLTFLALGSIPESDRLPKASALGSGTRVAPWGKSARVLSLTFLDVGEGDSIVIRFPDRRAWLLDAGGIRHPPSQEEDAYVFDIGEAVVSRYLWQYWIHPIDRVLISHPDMDHAGGIAAVMRNFHVGSFGYSRAGPDKMLSELQTLAVQRQVPMKQLHAAIDDQVGGVDIRVLNPPAATLFRTTNENSLVLKLSLCHFSILLTGDLEKAGEAAVLAQPDSLNCQFLKVAHHGSRAGTSDLFLDRTKPRWAILSVGRNNPFGHPAKETLNRLLQRGIRPISTIDEGAITIETDGIRYLLRSYINGVLESGEL